MEFQQGIRSQLDLFHLPQTDFSSIKSDLIPVFPSVNVKETSSPIEILVSIFFSTSLL